MDEEMNPIMVVISERHAKAFDEQVKQYEKERVAAVKIQEQLIRRLEEKIRYIQVCGGAIIITLLIVIGLLMWENWYLSDILLQL
ncbi:hypothetical protein [uncultured Megasphaera sp.]|uniref:hypothetical protein n=1 Tax=uncultured Megasphaera sp. TaxID=165188 RepID=UPI00265A4BA3|nr:hypothetical protein [uncultured Megasphaera sp.]